MRKVDQTKEMEAATLCKKEGNPYFWVTLFVFLPRVITSL